MYRKGTVEVGGVAAVPYFKVKGHWQMWNLLVTAASENEFKNHVLPSFKYFSFSQLLSAVIHHIAVKWMRTEHKAALLLCSFRVNTNS